MTAFGRIPIGRVQIEILKYLRGKDRATAAEIAEAICYNSRKLRGPLFSLLHRRLIREVPANNGDRRTRFAYALEPAQSEV